MKHWTISNSLATIVVVVCFGTLFSLINLYSGTERILRESDLTSRSAVTEQLTFSLRSDINQLHFHLHRWTGNSDPIYKQAYQETVQQLLQTLSRLKKNETSDTVMLGFLAALDRSVIEEIAVNKAKLAGTHTAALTDDILDARRFNLINTLLDYIQKRSDATLSKSHAAFVKAESDTRNRVVIISTLITILVIVLSFLIFQQNSTTHQLKLADQRIIDLYENSPCGYVALDEKATIIQINQTELGRLKRTKEEVVGKLTVFDLVHPEYRSKAYEIIDQLRSTGTLVDISVPLVNAEGHTYWLRTNATSEFDESGKRIHKVNTIEITENRQNLERIRFQSTLLEECNDAIISVDLETRITNWNKGAERLYGYTEQEALGLKLNDLVGLDKPFNENEIAGIIQSLMAQKRIIGERTHHNKAGEKLNILYSITSLMDKRGTIVGAVTIMQDISLRKRYEEHLLEFNIALEQKVKEKTEEFRNLVTGISEAVLAFDHELRFRFMNEKAAELIGGKPSDYLGKRVDEIEAPLNAMFADKLLQRVRDFNQSEIVELSCSNSGAHYLCRAYPTDAGITLLIENNTERIRAQEHLRDSEEKYRLFFESSPLPLYIFDTEALTVFDANAAACRQYGYSREQMIGMSALDMVESRDQTSVKDHLQAIHEGRRFEGTCKHKRKDRSAMQVEMFSETIHRNGREYRLVLAYDISARVAAEQELKRSHEEFRRLNQHMELIREEERTKISRELHDEIGQQMTVMKMDLAMLLRKAQREESRKTLHGLIDLADSTIATIRRISSSLRPGVLDDLGLLSAIQWHCKELGRHSKIPIQVISDGQEIEFDPETSTAIFRIVQEALTNILRHAKANHIEIVISTTAERWNISVRDNGVGFEKDASIHGLGLLGMQERARGLDADLDVISQPGLGTELRLSVPLNKYDHLSAHGQPSIDAHPAN